MNDRTVYDELLHCYRESCEAQFALILLIEGAKQGVPTPAAWNAAAEAFEVATDRLQAARRIRQPHPPRNSPSPGLAGGSGAFSAAEAPKTPGI